MAQQWSRDAASLSGASGALQSWAVVGLTLVELADFLMVWCMQELQERTRAPDGISADFTCLLDPDVHRGQLEGHVLWLSQIRC